MSKKTKHTPGPWTMKQVEIDLGEGHTCNGVEAIQPDICEMLSARPIGEVTANARLIVAAPELLEALERMYEENGAPSPEAINQALAAIRKAKGE